MLPVQDAIPSRTTPWTTLALVAALGIVALVEGLAGPAARPLILSYGLAPAHASIGTVLTATLLHYGLVDAAANLLALWIFGDNVEDRLGRPRFLGLFALGAAVSALVIVRLDPLLTAPIVGAGGAVGAVLGAYLVLLPAGRVLVLVPTWRGFDLVDVPAAIVLACWLLVVSLGVGARSAGTMGIPMTTVAQLAGMVAGAAAARLLARPERRGCDWWNVPAGQLPAVRRRTSRDTSASSVNSASN